MGGNRTPLLLRMGPQEFALRIWWLASSCQSRKSATRTPLECSRITSQRLRVPTTVLCALCTFTLDLARERYRRCRLRNSRIAELVVERLALGVKVYRSRFLRQVGSLIRPPSCKPTGVKDQGPA
jgi:hypothetical protein